MGNASRMHTLLLYRTYRGPCRTSLFSTPQPSAAVASSVSTHQLPLTLLNPNSPFPSSGSNYSHNPFRFRLVPSKPTSSFCPSTLRLISTTTSEDTGEIQETPAEGKLSSFLWLPIVFGFRARVFVDWDFRILSSFQSCLFCWEILFQALFEHSVQVIHNWMRNDVYISG